VANPSAFSAAPQCGQKRAYCASEDPHDGQVELDTVRGNSTANRLRSSEWNA
jgi:hypothetical protein